MTQTLKEKIDALEQNMLAINCLSNICTTTTGSHGDLAQSDVAFVLAYLSDESMFKVEALRMMIDAQLASVAQVPRIRERRRRKTDLVAVGGKGA